jgi:TPR repeat protein
MPENQWPSAAPAPGIKIGATVVCFASMPCNATDRAGGGRAMMRRFLPFLFLGSVVALTLAIAFVNRPVHLPPPKSPAEECQRINDGPFDQGWDEQARLRKRWIEVCRQAAASDPANLHWKHVLARALSADGQDAEAIVLWRELAAQNDAGAAFEIYDLYKSYYRGNVNKPQLVKRAEAEAGLRKAAELGDSYATLMLAVLLDRGDTVKRDPEDAIHWAERALANPAKDETRGTMQVLLGRLLVKSANPDEKARGLDLLERLAQVGNARGKTELAVAIRASDPARARQLLEQSLSADAGGAIPPLADMLIKGEGGPADPKRAVSLLSGRRASDVPGVRGALGLLYIEGKVVPRDLKKGIDLLRNWAVWDYDARLKMMKVLAENPELSIDRPEHVLYDLTEAAELGELGALDTLIEVKLSQSAQFNDKAGGCVLAARAAKSGDAYAALRLKECGGS